MKKIIKNNILMSRILIGLFSCLLMTSVQAGKPLWTIVPAVGSNPVVVVPQNGTASVQYLVQNQSRKSKRLVIRPMPGITQTTACTLAPRGQVGSTCTLNLNIDGKGLPVRGVHGGPALCQANPDGSPNPNQCYQPSAGNNLSVTREPAATISVNPTILRFAQVSTGTVTVTNSADSPFPADNVQPEIPVGSNIVVQSNTCGSSLAIGASCTITFFSNALEGPTIVPIAGVDTNTVDISIEVTNRPVIQITGPVQQQRFIEVSSVSLALEITNLPGSVVNANAVTVSNTGSCTFLSVDDSNCASVAPGASCTLILSSVTPYAPCTITVEGSNTAASGDATLIAFFYLGGFVFESNGVNGKVIQDSSEAFSSQWTSTLLVDILGSKSAADGVSNTNAITGNAACTGDQVNCAAYKCRNLNGISTPEWYLPAYDELITVRDALCPSITFPCEFGGYGGAGPTAIQYWSSYNFDAGTAYTVDIPNGNIGAPAKNTPEAVVCAQTF